MRSSLWKIAVLAASGFVRLMKIEENGFPIAMELGLAHQTDLSESRFGLFSCWRLLIASLSVGSKVVDIPCTMIV